MSETIDPKKFWGNCTWLSIHTIALGYEPSKRQQFLHFINSLVNLLPCPNCCEHLKKNLQFVPIREYLNNKDSVFLWSYRLHSRVNMQLKRKNPPMKSMKEMYERIYSDYNHWGKCFWRMIHSMAAAYNPSKADSFVHMIEALGDLLPDKRASILYKKNLKEVPISQYLGSRESIFIWSYLFHELYNKQLGKRPVDYMKAYEHYTSNIKVQCESCKI